MCAISRKGVINCFAISLRFRFAIQFETRLETCLQWLLRSLQLEETEQLIRMPVKFACCNQSVHVYQNCLEQSQKHVCDGAYDHYNYMETRLKLQSRCTLTRQFPPKVPHKGKDKEKTTAVFFVDNTRGREW